MIILSEKAYISQIIFYLRSKKNDEAFRFAKDFAMAYPDSMMAHFLLSKSSFALERYKESSHQARRAFNLASGKDMVTCGLLACSAYFNMEDYFTGYDILKELRRMSNDPRIVVLMTAYSIAMKDNHETSRNIDELYRIDSKIADGMIEQFVKPRL